VITTLCVIAVIVALVGAVYGFARKDYSYGFMNIAVVIWALNYMVLYHDKQEAESAVTILMENAIACEQREFSLLMEQYE
jgi:uncharacterized membrane protein